MTYSDFNHEQNYRFSKAQKLVHNGKQVDVTRQDLYTSVVEDIYSNYQLPALWLDDSGFAAGEADDEEFDTLFEVIQEIHFADCDNNIANLERSEVDNDEILLFLDKMLMNAEEEAYDEVLAKYEDDTFQELSEKYEISEFGTSVYVTTTYQEVDGEFDFDTDEFVQEAEELLRLKQVYGELPNFQLEYIEIDGEEDSIKAIFHFNAEEIIKHYCNNVNIAKNKKNDELIVTVNRSLNEQDDYQEIATKLLKYDINNLFLVQDDYEDTLIIFTKKETL